MDWYLSTRKKRLNKKPTDTNFKLLFNTFYGLTIDFKPNKMVQEKNLHIKVQQNT